MRTCWWASSVLSNLLLNLLRSKSVMKLGPSRMTIPRSRISWNGVTLADHAESSKRMGHGKNLPWRPWEPSTTSSVRNDDDDDDDDADDDDDDDDGGGGGDDDEDERENSPAGEASTTPSSASGNRIAYLALR
jgi:hypothetical protein